MKKFRVLSVVLVLVMLLSCVVTGYAEETPVTYTEEQVLGPVTLESGYDFTEMTAEEISACIAGATRVAVSADGGAKLSINHESTFSGEVQLRNLPYSDTDTRAVKFNFVAPENGTTIGLSLFSNNTRLRVFTYDNPNDEIDGYVIGCSNASFSKYVVTPGESYSVIAKKNVAGEKIDIYVKGAADEGYVRVLTGQPILVNSSATNWPDASKLSVTGVAKDDYAVFKDITLYGVAYSEAQLLSGLKKKDGFDFAEMSEEEIIAFEELGTNVIVEKDNGLKFTVGNEKKADGVTDLGYGEIDLGLKHEMKEGEAIKFSFMPTTESNSVLVMTDIQGNGERLKIRTEVVGNKQVLVYHTGEGGSGFARGISTFEVKAGTMYDIIVRKNHGAINIYAKETDANAYKLILSEQLIYSVAANANCYKLHISGATGSSAIFKEVTQYVEDVKEVPVTYTEAQVLGIVARESGYDFTEMTAEEISASISAATRIDISADGGAKLSINHESTFNGEVQLRNLPYSDTDTRAVKFNFVAPENGTTIGLSLFSNNTRLRVFTYDNPNDEIDGYVIGCSNASFSKYVVTPGKSYSVIAKKNVDGDKIDIYVKGEDDEGYTRVLTGQPILVNSSETNWPDASKLSVSGVAKDNYAVFKDITLYGVAYSEAQVLSGLKKKDGFDFAEMSEEEIAAFGESGTNVIAEKDNGLKFTVGDAKKADGVTDLGYGEIDLGLKHEMKEGEAIKFSFMPTTESNSVLVMTDFQGSGERLKIRTEVIGEKQVLVYHTGEGGSSFARGISTFEVAANKMYDVIAKKKDGKIEIYAKESISNGYKLILSEQLVYSVGANVNCYKLHITGAAGSSATFKEVTQYVEDVEEIPVTYTEAQVLGNVAWESGYDFTEMTAEEISASISGATRIDISADGGAKLSINHESTFNGEVQLRNLPYSATETRAAKFSFVAPENGTTIGLSLFSDNTRLRIFTYDNPNDEIDGYVIGCSNASFSKYVVTPGKSYNVIAKKNVDGDKIDIYVKGEDDEGYTRVLTGQPILVNSSETNWPDASKLSVDGIAKDNYAVFKDIALYGVGYVESEILAGTKLGENFDFDLMSAEEIEAYNSLGTNVIASKDNGLKLVVGDAKKNDGVTDLGYGEIDLGVQYEMNEGEALKFSFTPTTESNSVLVMTDIQGNGERLKIRTEVVGNKQVLVYHTGENGSGSSRGISTFEVKADKTYDIIAKKNGGAIDLYAKEATDEIYKLILSQQLVYSVAANAQCYKLNVSGAAGSTATFHEVSQYVIGKSKEEVLGNADAVLHHFDFDETYDGVAGKDAASVDGFAFNNEITRWDFNGNYIPAGGAMAVRFKINNSQFQSWVAGESGRAILLVDAAGKVKLKTRTEGNVQLDVATISQNTWYTFIIKDNGSGWDVYMAKDEAGVFAEKLITDVKEEAMAETNTYITLSGGAGTVVDYFTIFDSAATDVPVADGLQLMHQVDFVNEANALNDNKVITKRNATVDEGVLLLTQTTEEDTNVVGGYFYDNTGIPAGGYAEYSVKGSSIIHKFFQDGDYMGVNTVAYGMDGLTHTFKYPVEENMWTGATNVSHTPNVFWVYRVARSADGNTYSVWRKLAETDSWTKIFEDIVVRSGQSEVKCGFEGVGEVEYVKIYAPANSGMTLFDGDNTTIAIDGSRPIKYSQELKAIVNMDEDATLIFAIYDAEGCLRNLITESVAEGTELVTIKDVAAGDTVKVFLWNGIEGMRALQANSVVLEKEATLN